MTKLWIKTHMNRTLRLYQRFPYRLSIVERLREKVASQATNGFTASYVVKAESSLIIHHNF